MHGEIVRGSEGQRLLAAEHFCEVVEIPVVASPALRKFERLPACFEFAVRLTESEACLGMLDGADFHRAFCPADCELPPRAAVPFHEHAAHGDDGRGIFEHGHLVIGEPVLQRR